MADTPLQQRIKTDITTYKQLEPSLTPERRSNILDLQKCAAADSDVKGYRQYYLGYYNVTRHWNKSRLEELMEQTFQAICEGEIRLKDARPFTAFEQALLQMIHHCQSQIKAYWKRQPKEKQKLEALFEKLLQGLELSPKEADAALYHYCWENSFTMAKESTTLTTLKPLLFEIINKVINGEITLTEQRHTTLFEKKVADDLLDYLEHVHQVNHGYRTTFFAGTNPTKLAIALQLIKSLQASQQKEPDEADLHLFCAYYEQYAQIPFNAANNDGRLFKNMRATIEALSHHQKSFLKEPQTGSTTSKIKLFEGLLLSLLQNRFNRATQTGGLMASESAKAIHAEENTSTTLSLLRVIANVFTPTDETADGKVDIYFRKTITRDMLLGMSHPINRDKLLTYLGPLNFAEVIKTVSILFGKVQADIVKPRTEEETPETLETILENTFEQMYQQKFPTTTGTLRERRTSSSRMSTPARTH